MKKLLPLLVWSLTFAACGLGRPKDILPQDKMQAVLWDIAQGSEFVNGYVYSRYPDLNRAVVNQQALKQIFALHKISRKEFEKSLEYYQRKPGVFVAMLDSINAQQKRAKPAAPPAAADTTRAQSPAAEPASRRTPVTP